MAWTILGVVLLLTGIFLFCLWMFLYVDDEQRVQNKLVDWWCQLETVTKKSRGWETNWLRNVAGLTARGFDHLFGEKLLSARAVSVSLCLSLASFGISFLVLSRLSEVYQPFVLAAFIWVLVFLYAATTRYHWVAYLAGFLVISFSALAFFAVLASSDARFIALKVGPEMKNLLEAELDADEIEQFRKITDEEFLSEGLTRDEIRILREMSDEELRAELRLSDFEASFIVDEISTAMVELPGFKKPQLHDRAFMGSIFGVAFLLAVVSDFLVIFATRKILRLEAATTTAAQFLALSIFGVVFAVAFFAVPFVLGFAGNIPYELKNCLTLIATMNWSVVLIASSSLLFGFLLLANRIVWPFLAGKFDSISASSINKQRAWCLGVSLTLFGISSQLLGIKWMNQILEWRSIF